MKGWIFVILLYFFSVLNVSGQHFGGNPPYLKWNQINTDSVRVIFPPGLQEKAREVVSIVQALASKNPNSLGNRVRKINIVLQNQSMVSNAYVGLGPFRSEFLLTPEQNSFDLGSVPWHKTLALHEYRHVHQFNNFRKGISQLFGILAGELGLSFANNTSIPDWFWEGDAVYQETYLTEQGRGRLPFFFNGYRSIWASERNYSWMKLRNGSLRDYVPNHYQLGYLLTAYGYEKYGPEFWGKVTDDAARFNGLFYPFQKAIRKHSGIDFRDFREKAVQYFRDQQPDTTEKNPVTEFAKSQKHFYGNAEGPQWVDESRIVYVKTSNKKIPQFIVRDVQNGSETKLAVKDISLDNYFSLRNNRIVYAAFKPDIRWAWREFSEIRLLNIETKEQKTITHRSRYFAPDISENGEEIVAVNNKVDGNSFLTILNVQTGNVIAELPNRDKLIYTHPKFFQEKYIISAVRNGKSEMALVKIDRTNGNLEFIIPYSLNVLGFHQVNGDTITFTMAQGNQDKLFLYSKNKFYEFMPATANRSTGNYQLSNSGNKYAWVSATSAGFYLQSETNSGALSEVSVNELIGKPDNLKVSYPESMKFLDTLQAPDYPVSRYRKSIGLLRFHSWLPSIDDPEYQLSLIGENVLNTFQSELYFTYNRNEQSKKIGYTAAYGAWFPWIRFGGNYTFERSTTFGGKEVLWNEVEGSGGFLIPLNLAGGKYFRAIETTMDFVYNKPTFKQPFKDSFDDRGFGYIRAQMVLTNQVQRARQHIFPRFAQTLLLMYNNALVSAEGHQALANLSLFFPGFHSTHNIVINSAIHRRDTLQQIRFTNNFPFSRGYSGINYHHMAKMGFNYHLPLAYPDWGFASIVYFMRVRSNLYYDHTSIMDYNSQRKQVKLDYRSFGTEIFFDTKWWNQHPVSFGIRYSRLLDAELQGLSPNQWEVILPVNLLGR